MIYLVALSLQTGSLLVVEFVEMSFDTMSADDIENEMMYLLSGSDATVLEGVYPLVSLPCSEELKGKKKLLLRNLLRYLNSTEIEEREDGGASLFSSVYDYLSNRDEKQLPPALEKNPVTSASDVGKTDVKIAEKTAASRPLFDMQKLKDFKISGSIGTTGKKDCLSFSSLNYQIKNGQKQGYSEAVIISAVLRAITPDNNLRTYLETLPKLDISLLLSILRSNYHEKDSASVFAELSNAVQNPSETCLDFVVRVMCLRQKVITLGTEEGVEYEETLVQKRFLHTVETGLRNNNIRAEVRETTGFYKAQQKLDKSVKITDEELLKVVTEAVSNENERSGKFSGLKRDTVTNVNKIDSEKGNSVVGSDKVKKENGLQIQIQELKQNQEKELALLRSDLSEIKSALSSGSFSGNQSQSGNYGQGGGRNFNGDRNNGGGRNFNSDRNGGRYQSPRFQNRKCANCRASNFSGRCMHCFKCGSSEHRMVSCDQKNC